LGKISKTVGGEGDIYERRRSYVRGWPPWQYGTLCQILCLHNALQHDWKNNTLQPCASKQVFRYVVNSTRSHYRIVLESTTNLLTCALLSCFREIKPEVVLLWNSWHSSHAWITCWHKGWQLELLYRTGIQVLQSTWKHHWKR
jgi:hypothetical protein